MLKTGYFAYSLGQWGSSSPPPPWLRYWVQLCNRPVDQAVTRLFLERKVRGSNLWPVKSDTVLPTARHRCNISSERAVLPGRNDTEMGPTNSFHTLAYYCERNERFDLIRFDSSMLKKIKFCGIQLEMEFPTLNVFIFLFISSYPDNFIRFVRALKSFKF